MTAALLAVATITSIVTCVLVIRLELERRRPLTVELTGELAETQPTTALDELERRLVVVHTIDGGPSMRGVLTGVYVDAVTVEAPEHLDAGERLAGSIAIPRDRILFVQDVPAPPVVAADETSS